ncbi:helix-turn-helix domain-containing protein [Marinobacter zhanjiangensis]|uniref:Transcriptional regulator n=1 Tax=Marinobacter zhanjiangensis TaxID=578215 RepID=A0ABQ3AZN3_9GAMM|nr:helix-turn-helix domain-containing protein [Marinobacter zhanjiangensis]GGY72885.1 transcriptional regulator [Marinobacter zhanjiangensis]
MKITSPELLAQAIRNARVDHNLSQQSVAELVGIKQNTVSSFENHPEKSRVETLFRLLSALNLELSITERNQSPAGTGWKQEW